MAAGEVTTLIVRGEGGHEFEMDQPAEGTNRREIFDEFVAKGWLTVVGEAEKPKPAPVKSAAKAAEKDPEG